MARIGILTFHRSINYGAFIQSLALSHEIAKRFPDCSVEVIDYSSAKMERNYRVKLDKYCVKHPTLFFQRLIRKRAFRDSLKHLPLSDKTIISDECGEVFDYINDNYDIVIVGSDAVWNWIKRGFPNPYIMDLDRPVVRMSYAASAFGMGEEHITPERAECFGRSLERFKFISVRDSYTSYIVKKCAPASTPYIVCDPTAFLDIDHVLALLGHSRESYKKYIYKKYRIPEEKRLICAMGSSRAIVRRIKKKYRDTHRIISVFSNTGEEDHNMYDLTPLEWSLIFSLCDLTITNFFHGTLLSLRNSTPVIAIDHTEFGATHRGKLQDVCERIGMGDCFFKLGQAREDGWNAVFERACDIMDNNREYCDRIKDMVAGLVQSSEIFFEALAEHIPSGSRMTVDQKNCTGCALCAERCPSGAISFKLEKGFFRPYIDNKKCVDCGLCAKGCPVLRPGVDVKPISVYALRDKDESALRAASSGGAFGLLAREIIARGGAVTGVRYDENMNAVHALARTEEELAAFCGSKYLQSDMSGIFGAVKAELDAGHPVLMSGTPCQAAAVRSYFGDREGLYTVDLICHGVQSPEVFKGYISALEKRRGKKVVDFRFRDKHNGWKKSNVRVIYADGSEEIMTRAECEYFNYFNYLRKSCYSCRFRGDRGTADITLGDYWGIETLPGAKDDDRGTSIVLIKTQRGKELFDMLGDRAELIESTVEHAHKTHKKLSASIPVPALRDRFFAVLEKNGYRKARRYYLRKTRLFRLKKKIKNIGKA